MKQLATISILTLALFLTLVLPAKADITGPIPCNSANEGKMLYNADHKMVQFCNGTNWIAMAGGSGGGGGNILETLSCNSGDTPAWDGSAWICSSALPCTTPWGASVAGEESVTAYQSENVAYNESCTSETRTCTDRILSGSYTYESCTVAEAPTCMTTDVIGTECDDGQFYIGTVDGNRIYAAPSDETELYYWGTYGYTTGADSRTDGAANTQDAYGHITAGHGSYNPNDGYTNNAIVVCHEKETYGHDDWYLPAIDELSLIPDNFSALSGKGFDTSGVCYWSSTELGSNDARVINTSGIGCTPSKNGFIGAINKVRCVRQD